VKSMSGRIGGGPGDLIRPAARPAIVAAGLDLEGFVRDRVDKVRDARRGSSFRARHGFFRSILSPHESEGRRD